MEPVAASAPLAASRTGAARTALLAAGALLAPEEREEYESGMRAWLATQPPGQALWVELEGAAGGGVAPAAIVAHVRAPSGELRSIELGRCGHHPTRVLRRRDAEAELSALLAREAETAARA